MTARPLALLPLALAALAAGCGASVGTGDDNASGKEVAKQVRPEYERQTSLRLTRLDCQEAKAKVGAPVECAATNSNDVELEIRGRVTAVEDGKVRFRWEVAGAIAPGRVYATAAQQQLEQSVGQPVEDLTCPDRIRVRAGARVRCELTTRDDQRYGVTLTLKDGKGGFNLRVDEKPKAD